MFSKQKTGLSDTGKTCFICFRELSFLFLFDDRSGAGCTELPLDNVSRADGCALAASDTSAVIDVSQIVLNRDGGTVFQRAFTLALHTADTADIALFHHDAALFLAGAGGNDLLFVRDHLDDLLRADISTGAAGHAFLAVNVCHTVFNAHCAELAGFHTGAETDCRVSRSGKTVNWLSRFWKTEKLISPVFR